MSFEQQQEFNPSLKKEDSSNSTVIIRAAPRRKLSTSDQVNFEHDVDSNVPILQSHDDGFY